MEPVEAVPDGVRIRLRVQPRASRTAITSAADGRIRVALTAPPVDGAANASLIKALAEALGVPPRRVALAAGEKSRDKVVEVTGVEASWVRERLRVSGNE